MAIALGLVVGPSAAPQQVPDRVALVIGNSTYGPIGDLENPRNDAADVGAALERLGFDVTTVLDVDQFAFNQALLDFTRRSVGADAAFVFYAGHGIEVDGVNYMVPVNARLERDTDLRFAAVSLDNMLAATRGAALRVVILDACRNNPLARTIRRTSSTRSMSRGSFGAVDEEALGDETLVAYAAAAGTTASDGTGDRNSPYTAALLEYLEQPLELSAMFRRVRARVLETTDRAQRPHEYGSLLRDHYLGGTSAVVTPPVLTELQMRQELAFWESIADSENPADFEAYLAQYADGQFARLAENRVAALREARLWAAVAGSENPADFAAYLEQYATGRYAPLARQRFAALSAPPPTREPVPYAPSEPAVPAIGTPAASVEREAPAIAAAPVRTEPAPAAIETPVAIGRDPGPAADVRDPVDLSTILNRRLSASRKDDNDWTDLHYAAAANLPRVVRGLLSERARVDAELKRDGRPLTAEVRRALLQVGHDFDTWTRDGETPLHVAAFVGARDAALELLASGANQEAGTKFDWRPLHYSAWAGAADVVELLLTYGADIDARTDEVDRPGRTALELAVEAGNSSVAGVLRANGASG